MSLKPLKNPSKKLMAKLLKKLLEKPLEKPPGKRMLMGLTMVAVLLPSAVQAASFSFGDKAVVGLFRGAGGLLGSSNSSDASGIDTLADRIDSELADYALTTQVFNSYEGNVFDFREVGSREGTDFFNSLSENPFETRGATGLIGYSAGGLSAIRTAKSLSPKPIDLLIQVESFDPLTGSSNEDEVLPPNVETGINYYQRRNRFNVFRSGWDPTDLQGATNVSGAENINAESLLDDRSLTHRNIISNSRFQQRIVQDIKDNLLAGLSFDRSGQLALGNGANKTNNILRLTPDGESRAADVRLAEPISSDSSFQSRLEFRLPFETISEGLSFWLGPNDGPEGDRQLTLKFDPLLPTESIISNKLLLLMPGQGSDSENAPFALNGRDPITAWIDYDSDINRYEVFISDTGNKPQQSIFSRTIDLSALGDRTYFGFRAAGADDGQYADLLSWQLQTIEGPSSLVEADAVPVFLTAIAPLGAAQTNWPVASLQPTSESVPEPSLLLALGVMGSGLWWVRRRV
ncbi:PEP-CTERM sorting domain-containing protein [Leptothoe sp. PORK10 BA2]|uniref:PEP-CTERM sorting domain-containing protein n=1 Tax=Leptothoe sp. PORK10 BA2 TaxID=3110254 RepID=UPI002B2215B3|nr:PEP-CTERM sorting domain-containing protein [Leptothoe sp. PORK10 BA2]MEA5466617.1 PEP-CTERM sorting domain-containing protein [Leptothoe sp. PORK10 BA2]